MLIVKQADILQGRTTTYETLQENYSNEGCSVLCCHKVWGTLALVK